MAMTDEQAMWRVHTQDDHRAFAELVDRWEDRVWRLCARIVGDPHRAEDLKQEAFARLFEKRRDYRPPMKVSAWLRRIAINLCCDEVRRITRRGESTLKPEQDAASSGVVAMAGAENPPDLRTAELEEGEIVRRALLQLPEMYRAVLVLRHYEGLKLREIAEVLEVPEGTVNSRMAAALGLLAAALKPVLQEEPIGRATLRAGNVSPAAPPQTQPKLSL
jgi:RNA polymerase sigma-70 factor, ECF subfamily